MFSFTCWNNLHVCVRVRPLYVEYLTKYTSAPFCVSSTQVLPVGSGYAREVHSTCPPHLLPTLLYLFFLSALGSGQVKNAINLFHTRMFWSLPTDTHHWHTAFLLVLLANQHATRVIYQRAPVCRPTLKFVSSLLTILLLHKGRAPLI